VQRILLYRNVAQSRVQKKLPSVVAERHVKSKSLQTRSILGLFWTIGIIPVSCVLLNAETPWPLRPPQASKPFVHAGTEVEPREGVLSLAGKVGVSVET
jgi:hypothetical protein